MSDKPKTMYVLRSRGEWDEDVDVAQRPVLLFTSFAAAELSAIELANECLVDAVGEENLETDYNPAWSDTMPLWGEETPNKGGPVARRWRWYNDATETDFVIEEVWINWSGRTDMEPVSGWDRWSRRMCIAWLWSNDRNGDFKALDLVTLRDLVRRESAPGVDHG